jgi:dipeptidyl aminopeptidase/acylaminoacyl peptidase
MAKFRPLLLTAAMMMLGAAAPVLAQPAAAKAEPAPWSAPASVTVLQEEKTFHSAAADLSGTLYLPQGGKALGLVVVAHGASMPSRDHALYRHLKEMLPPLGVAVFAYDRRGSGKSGGDLQTSDYALLADDAIAAANMLSSDPRIDPKRIGVWGLSQGGWLSLLAASRSPVISFAVSISAPVVTPDVQMVFASANILRVNGYADTDIAQAVAVRKAVDDYMRGTGDRATAQRLLDAAKVKPWFQQIYMSDTLEDPATSRWRKEIEHDPLKTLDDVKVPALLLYGAADPWVPVATSVERLKAIAAKHRNLDVAVVARADHAMQLSVAPKTQMDPAAFREQAPESVEYFGLLASWLTRHGIAKPAAPN